MHFEDHYFPPISTGTSPTNGVQSQSRLEAKTRSSMSGSPSNAAAGRSPKSPKSAWNIPLKKSSFSNTTSSTSFVHGSNAWAGPSRISPPTARQQERPAKLPAASSHMADEMDDDQTPDSHWSYYLSMAEARSRSEDV